MNPNQNITLDIVPDQPKNTPTTPAQPSPSTKASQLPTQLRMTPPQATEKNRQKIIC
jgi:hypothetical protein